MTWVTFKQSLKLIYIDLYRLISLIYYIRSLSHDIPYTLQVWLDLPLTVYDICALYCWRYYFCCHFFYGFHLKKSRSSQRFSWSGHVLEIDSQCALLQHGAGSFIWICCNAMRRVAPNEFPACELARAVAAAAVGLLLFSYTSISCLSPLRWY